MASSFGDWFKTPTRAEQLRAAGEREDLVQAAERTPFSKHSDGMLRDLPMLLTADEVVVDLVEGRHGKQIGLLVQTTRRVLFVPKPGHRSGVVVIDRSDVVTADAFTHRGMSAVTMVLTGGEFVVDQILGNQAEAFAAHLLQPGARPGEAPDVEGIAVRDPIEELIELRAMHRAGVVTDGEFQLRKKQLFDRI